MNHRQGHIAGSRRRITQVAFASLLTTIAVSAQCPPCAAEFDDAVFLTAGVAAQDTTYGIRIRPRTTVVVFTILIMTNGTNGTVGLWSDNATRGTPDKPIVHAGWATNDVTPNWKGATFSKPTILTANQDYWVVLRTNPASSIPSLRAKSSNGQHYAYSQDDGLTWTSVGRIFEWKYRLHCCPIPNLASATAFGSACGGSSFVPSGTNAVPVFGTQSAFSVEGVRANAPALLAIGGSNLMWGAFPLPLDLTPAGAPNCSIYASLDVLGATVVSGIGTATLLLPIPRDNALLGLAFYSQWIVLDPAANRFGAAFSQGVRSVIGA
ncbi:MAG: hypothetical protein H6832_18970 [Planctomycetes bacterium]|nr:hypothetical protein [Planctomycetota bacterium]MCB9920493.1 hypothetical protein [Planctomycetota bacterium]